MENINNIVLNAMVLPYALVNMLKNIAEHVILLPFVNIINIENIVCLAMVSAYARIK